MCWHIYTEDELDRTKKRHSHTHTQHLVIASQGAKIGNRAKEIEESGASDTKTDRQRNTLQRAIHVLSSIDRFNEWNAYRSAVPTILLRSNRIVWRKLSFAAIRWHSVNGVWHSFLCSSAFSFDVFQTMGKSFLVRKSKSVPERNLPFGLSRPFRRWKTGNAFCSFLFGSRRKQDWPTFSCAGRYSSSRRGKKLEEKIPATPNCLIRFSTGWIGTTRPTSDSEDSHGRGETWISRVRRFSLRLKNNIFLDSQRTREGLFDFGRDPPILRLNDENETFPENDWCQSERRTHRLVYGSEELNHSLTGSIHVHLISISHWSIGKWKLNSIQLVVHLKQFRSKKSIETF